jgi:hypothetical protein
MIMALPILNFSQFNLLHYYENRDDGLYHVIRQLSDVDGNQYLDRITQGTGFERDRNWLEIMPTISIKKDAFSHADAQALKDIFPGIKMVNVPDELVTYDARTLMVDRSGYQCKNPGSPFDERNALNFGVEREITSLLINDGNYNLSYELREDAAFNDKVGQALNRFHKGEISPATWPIWIAHFSNERSYLNVSDLETPEWKPFFDRLWQSLELTMHPGAHRFYPVPRDIDPADDMANNSLFSKNNSVFPSSGPGRVEFSRNFMGDSNTSWLIHASIGKRNEAVSTEAQPISTKGYIELGYDPDTGMSKLAKIDDIPLPLRARLAHVVKVSAHENRMFAHKIRTEVQAVRESLDQKLGQDAIAKRVQALTLTLSAVLSATVKSPLTLRKVYNRHQSRLLDMGISDALPQLIQDLTERGKRVASVFNRALQRTESITSIEERKEVIQTLIQTHLDIRRGLGSDVTVHQQGILEVKELFNDIDTLTDLEDIFRGATMAFDKDSRAVISQVLASYNNTKEEIAREHLKQQQEINRVQLTNVSLNNLPLGNTTHLFGENAADNNKVVHEDVGEKIGGARKDLYTRITSSNVHELNLEEKIKYVKKDRIWPKPNWDALHEEGLSPFHCYYIKVIRDAIEPQAQKLSRSVYRKSSSARLAEQDEDFAYWLQAVEYVRDKLAEAKEDTFRETIQEIAKFLDQPVSEAHKSSGRHFDDSTTFGHALGNSYKRKFLLGRQLENGYLYEKNYRKRTDEYYKQKLNIKPKNTQTDNQGGEGEQESDETKSKLKLPYPEHLKHLTRAGEDWRKGVNVTGEDMINTFGFRGIEYGNWVANNERQIVLNHAFDAFMDLAYSIGLSRDQFHMISMNGTLALGFGSRGHGRALAHYEPIHNVINITKIKGAGSMGHEWFHAFDAYLAKLTGLTTLRDKLFSEIVDKMPAHTREHTLSKIQDPAIKAMAIAVIEATRSCKYKKRTPERIEQDVENIYTKRAQHLASWARSLAYDYLKETRGLTTYPSTHQAEVVAMLKELMAKDEARSISSEQFLGNIAAMIVMRTGDAHPLSDKQKERLIENLVSRMGHKAKEQSRIGLDYLVREIHTAKNSTIPVETDYLLEAQKLDGKSKRYWQSPCELLARSFSVAIYEKLKGEHLQSDYLVRGAERKEFADSAVYKGNSNPEGDERDTLNDCHDKILRSIFEHAQSIWATPKQQDELVQALSM